MPCSAACIRQLAKDNGINITEEAVEFEKGDYAETSKQLNNFLNKK